MGRRFEITVSMLCFISVFAIAQKSQLTKYDEMLNAFLLGLDTKGLELCHELISKNENKDQSFNYHHPGLVILE